MNIGKIHARSIVVMSILFMALAFSPLVSSFPTGISGVKDSGCNCHGATTSDIVVPTIIGLPSIYNYSESYEVTVAFTGGPSTIGNINLGGFHLWASEGELSTLDATVQQFNPSEVGHTEVGNDQTTWTLMWTAPASDKNIEFILHTNSVNGNAGGGAGSSGDEWNRISVKVSAPIEVLEQANPYVVLSTLIVISAILLAITVTYIFYRTNPDSFNWETFEPWIVEWLTSTDHKKVGTLYFLAGMFFLGIGGIMALMIRIQLSVPGNDFLTQDQYNQFFTLHGTTMIFLAAMPLINGFANWMVPLQIGAPDLALPRINAMSFWLQPVGALLIFTGVFSGTGADTGWTGYAPYIVSETAHVGTTMWVAGQLMLVASSTLTGVNFLTTIAVMRAPGMGWMQMPLFTWSILVANLMLFLSIPAFGVGLVQVYLDRVIGTAFYDASAGGDPLLWSHLFWYFGHPEVYVVIVPAFGVISEVIATSARRSVFGYRSMVYAMAGIGVVSFIVYGHHMFTSGMSPTLRFVTMLTTMLVAVPTGIKIFNWLKTMHRGSLVYRTHTLWALGFLITFTLGGISGMFFPSMAMDLHFHESYFVVAHFHYVLVGGTVFGFFSAIYYWFPKMTGKMLDERLGVLHFLTAFISYNGVFWPMHRLGVWGMARRHHTYFISTEEAMGSLPIEAAGWNMFISVSAFLFFFSNFILIANMIKSVIRGQKAPADPWGGWSFEWMTSSPPPTPSFGHFHDGVWSDLPTLKDANEDHIANEPSAVVKWFQSLMVLDDENEEASH
ncbi:MAG: cytochrome c oxidase subunit I [Candidatus Poseidoniales archaeon]|jgi:cytochrome c oxidase subunit 1|tara:strand:+ start:3508 stop:5853 length:2346 start_codon:yes stop_codon:yes gene_type:complete